MSKQTINIGTAANAKNGDSLRAAFNKVNQNFTELYTALGINADVNLNLGAFEFAGSVLSTTDSSAIVIDQAVTVSSNLTVGGDVLPSVANGGDLGSSARPWKSLYISNNTIYIGGTSVGVDSQGNLLVGGQPIADVGTAAWNSITGKPTFATVATTGAYADLTGKPTIPTLVSQLANDSGFLTSVGNISNIQSEGNINIEVNLTDSTKRIWQFGEDGSLTFPDATVQTTAYTSVYAQSGATSAYATQRVLQYNPSTNAVTYSNYIDATSIYVTGYSSEIHVSPVAYDDSGNGTIGDPVKTIARAQALAALAFETTGVGQRKSIILHPGDYAENVTISTQYTVLTTHELVGKNTTLSGTLTITTGCTIEGLKITNLVVSATSATGSVDLIGCTVTVATTKTSSAYTVFRGCDLSGSSMSITGSGTTVLVGGNYGTLTVNNAAAGVLVKAVVSMGAVTLTAGTLQLSDTLILATTSTSNAITTSAGSVITVNNCQTLVPALNNVARNSFSGFYSILHSVYDKINTTFATPSASGASLNSISYSQYINADRLILSSGGQITFPDATVQTTAWTGSGGSSLVNGAKTVSLDSTGSLTIPGDIKSNSNINIDINLADSTLRRWQFGEDGILTLPSVGKISNGAYDWTFGSTGITTFPGVINAGNINNLVVNDLGDGTSLTAGSQVQIGNNPGIAGAGVLIKNAVTNILGGETSLEQGSKIQMDNGNVSLFGYTYSSLGAGSGLENQLVVEVDNSYPNNVVRIGTRSITTVEGTATLNVFQGVTFSQYGDITFPDATVQTTAYNPSNIRSEGNINIDINLSDSTLRRWSFGEDGSLTLPIGVSIDNNVDPLYPRIIADSGKAFSVQGQGNSGSAALAWTVNPDAASQYAAVSVSRAGGDNLAKVVLQAQSNSGDGATVKLWKFDETGALTIPGDIRSEGNINIEINLADSTLRRWSFGEDGELTLPTDAVVKTTSGHLTIKGQEYVFIDSATNGQINIGTSSGVGSVVLGSKSRGTNVVVDDLQVANGVYEFFSSLADATGVVTHNCANGHIFYHTSPDANWTVNLTNLLDTWNRATSVTLIIAQGATGYIPNAVQIAGVAQTIKWQGNVTPTPSTNRTDVVIFSIINVSGTYTVLGQLTGF